MLDKRSRQQQAGRRGAVRLESAFQFLNGRGLRITIARPSGSITLRNLEKKAASRVREKDRTFDRLFVSLHMVIDANQEEAYVFQYVAKAGSKMWRVAANKAGIFGPVTVGPLPRHGPLPKTPYPKERK